MRHSWISANGVGGTSDPDPFAGLNFGASISITNIAWGRDNGDPAEGGCRLEPAPTAPYRHLHASGHHRTGS